MVQGDVRARATPLVIHVRLRVANGSSSRPVTSRREIGSPCTHQAVGRCDTATATGRPAGRARSAVRLLQYYWRGLLYPEDRRSERWREARRMDRGEDHAAPTRPTSYRRWPDPAVAERRQADIPSGRPHRSDPPHCRHDPLTFRCHLTSVPLRTDK
jgi:hypothetical protein